MQVILFLQNFSSPILDRLFQFITMLGEDYFFILLAAFIFWCRDKKFGYLLGFAYLTNGLVNIFLKEAFQIARPIGREGVRSLRLSSAGGYSFPSGHTQSASAIAASFALRYRNNRVYFTVIPLAILVGVSRMYLGVHWPTDVLAGLIIGFLWVYIANKIFNYVDMTENYFIFLAVIIPMAVIMYLFPTYTCFKAAGSATGIIMGYIIESRYIDFRPEARTWQQPIKYIFGIAVLILIKIYGKSILPPTLWSDFARYLTISLWFTAGAPYLFMKIFRSGKQTSKEPGRKNHSFFTG
ncbi:MAG: phosphatase PAP2 family protein [Halanaerobium sp.]|nr:phosphatase PAP2 family protein [Halanaerobium sp.]